jgi:hypothetical protein
MGIQILMRQQPPIEQGGYAGRREDDAECRTGDRGRPTSELRVKLPDIRSHDRDVAAELAVRIE